MGKFPHTFSVSIFAILYVSEVTFPPPTSTYTLNACSKVSSGQLRQILQKQIHIHSRPFVLRTIGGELLHKFKFWKTMGWAHAWNHNFNKIAILYLRSPWCSPWDLSIAISVTRLGYFLKGKSYCINFLDKYLKYFWILFFYPTSA